MLNVCNILVVYVMFLFIYKFCKFLIEKCNQSRSVVFCCWQIVCDREKEENISFDFDIDFCLFFQSESLSCKRRKIFNSYIDLMNYFFSFLLIWLRERIEVERLGVSRRRVFSQRRVFGDSRRLIVERSNIFWV